MSISTRKNHMVFSITLLFITLYTTCACEAQANTKSTWAKTVGLRSKQKTTLEFYYHDIISGDSPTAMLIARANRSTDSAPLAFGKLFMFDDPLTMGPDPASKLVGRAQGMYGSDSLGDDVGLIMAMGFTFTEGIYNGSSISILVHNPITVKHRELPIVGGTGLFRMAQGFLVPNTYMLDLVTGDAIVGYNVTIFHYNKNYFEV